MKKLADSRGPTLNNDVCADKIGNRFDLVLVASARAREIVRHHVHTESKECVYAPVSALLEIQEGKIGREYLKKVR
jgi:DNA-directed RNA polymerase omega subunit